MSAPAPPLSLLIDDVPRPPALDTALSRAILLEVAGGRRPATVRLARPAAMVAFGRVDAVSPGYGAAVAAARAQGFEAVERLAGGRAAVFHERTVAFAWATPAADPRAGVHDRFGLVAEVMREALTALGVDARVGEVAGEYCPGAYSVSARGRRKLMGVGQRLVAGGAHTGGVVVVGDSARVRDVLVPVYGRLDLAWDPATAGAVEDEVGPVGWDAAVAAITAALGHRFALASGTVGAATLAAAARLEAEHRSPAPVGAAAGSAVPA